MKFGLVAWSFTDGERPQKKYYVYKTELENLQFGDVVLLETKEGTRMGVFYKYIEEDRNPFGMYRVSIIKKVHTNTIKARIRKRYEEFKNIQFSKKEKLARKMNRRMIQFFGTDNERLIYRKILRTLCYGNEVSFPSNPRAKNFYYKNRFLSVYLDKKGVWRILGINEFPNGKWIKASKNHQILTDLMKNDEVKHTKIQNTPNDI